MVLLEMLICILAIAGAVYFGRKRKTLPMILCIVVAVIMICMFGALYLLISAID